MISTKIVSILMALLTLISGTAAATTVEEPEIYTQHGYVMEILEDGAFLLLNQDNQTVQVNVDETTVVDRLDDLQVGQYVLVDFDGKTTRSIPAQLYAQSIFGATINGIVSAVNGTEITLIEDETQQEYIVNMAEDAVLPVAGEHIAVHFNGAVTMSLPAQIGALAWDVIPSETMRGE